MAERRSGAEAMKVLVIRRDNIGDLVCTTPLLAALRRQYPEAWIGALVNSYNARVLDRNPDLDEVVVYQKIKHLEAGQGAVRALARRLASFWRLRRRRLDAVLIATPEFVPRTARLARWLTRGKVVGYADGSTRAAGLLDIALPASATEGLHEVERVFLLGRALGIAGAIPPVRVVPDAQEARKAAAAFPHGPALRVAVHISARRVAQRWPAERFAALIERLHAAHGAVCMLLWFPGPPDHPLHPGDDDKADEIVRRVGNRAPLVAYRAGPLPELVGALAACEVVVTPDGGAMHLAAGLGKPILCLFGDAAPERWHPWGVAHEVLQPPGRDVAELSVDETARAFERLMAATRPAAEGRP